MKPTRTMARCPCFTSRVDYHGAFYIACIDIDLRFATREARDKVYMTACCEDPEQCPRDTISREQLREARKNRRGNKPVLTID